MWRTSSAAAMREGARKEGRHANVKYQRCFDWRAWVGWRYAQTHKIIDRQLPSWNRECPLGATRDMQTILHRDGQDGTEEQSQ